MASCFASFPRRGLGLGRPERRYPLTQKSRGREGSKGKALARSKRGDARECVGKKERVESFLSTTEAKRREGRPGKSVADTEDDPGGEEEREAPAQQGCGNTEISPRSRTRVVKNWTSKSFVGRDGTVCRLTEESEGNVPTRKRHELFLRRDSEKKDF